MFKSKSKYKKIIKKLKNDTELFKKFAVNQFTRLILTDSKLSNF